MPVMTEIEAETDLLLIEALEIEPLPDGLIMAEAAGTSDFPGCCSCEWCSSAPDEPPPPPKECWVWTLFEA